LADILDFQKTFAETRAQTKAVDLELRRLDAEEARNHVCYLLSFMPPAFLARGGDHDAILMLLLIPRITQKTEILISQVREKYKSIEKIDRYIDKFSLIKFINISYDIPFLLFVTTELL